jgi:hypothetical protein
MARSQWKAPSRGLSLDDLKEAGARIGRRTDVRSGIATRARWLVRFARRDLSLAALEGLPARERYLSRMEAAIFAKGPRYSLTAEDLPDKESLRDAQRRLHAIFAQLSAGREALVEAQRWIGALSIQKGIITHVTPINTDVPFVDGFLVQVHGLLPWLQLIRLRLHFCTECQQAFLAKRPDATTCSPSCRTLSWRKANPERFREWRSANYRTRAAKRLGKTVDKVQIQRRKRKETR